MGNAAALSGKGWDSAECRTYSDGDGCCEDCNDEKLHHFGFIECCVIYGLQIYKVYLIDVIDHF